jgi:hypothetical protein
MQGNGLTECQAFISVTTISDVLIFKERVHGYAVGDMVYRYPYGVGVRSRSGAGG